MREDPVISDQVHVLGGSTEGTLGRLAGAAAGGAQGMLAAGDSVNFFGLPCRAAFPLSTCRATKRSVAHRDLSLESDRFLIVGVDGDRAQLELACFTAVASFKKNLA